MAPGQVVGQRTAIQQRHDFGSWTRRQRRKGRRERHTGIAKAVDDRRRCNGPSVFPPGRRRGGNGRVQTGQGAAGRVRGDDPASAAGSETIIPILRTSGLAAVAPAGSSAVRYRPAAEHGRISYDQIHPMPTGLLDRNWCQWLHRVHAAFLRASIEDIRTGMMRTGVSRDFASSDSYFLRINKGLPVRKIFSARRPIDLISLPQSNYRGGSGHRSQRLIHIAGEGSTICRR